MKLIGINLLRLLSPVLLIAVAAAPGSGQDARLRISNLDRLETRAAQVIDVSIDERMLKIAAKFLNLKDPDQAKIRELVSGLKGVYVKSYDFDKPDQYSAADVEPISTQLKAPGWFRMVGVRSTRDNENIEVYTMLNGDNISGIAVIAAEPTQLTVINIVGPIDLEKLTALEGNFGIPRLGMKRYNPKPKEQ
jgi:hypothetical protein